MWSILKAIAASGGKVVNQATYNSYQSDSESMENHCRASGSGLVEKAYTEGIARPQYIAIGRIHLKSATVAELMVANRIFEVSLEEQAQSWTTKPFQHLY